MAFSMDMIPSAVIVLAITSIIVVVVKLLMRMKRLQKELADFPMAPDYHWLFGHMHKITLDEKELEWLLSCLTLENSKAAVIWLGPFMPVITTFHYENVKAVLNSGDPKADYLYDFMRPWLGDGLLLSHGQKWARNRRLLTPGFHFDILKPYTEIFQQSADILVEKWRSASGPGGDGKSYEISRDLSLLTLDSLLKCIFSMESNCQIIPDHPYINGMYKISQLVQERFRFLPYHVDAIYNWSPSGRRYRQAYESVHKFAQDIIAERKETLARGEGAPLNRKHKKYVDFIDILLCAKDEDGLGLSDQEINDEVNTFMFEGHDTTASSISWFLYNMACHPKYQQRCRNEVNDLLANKQCDNLAWDDLSKLPYLTCCLKESHRLHTTVPYIMRNLAKDLTLPDGRTIPKGTVVGLVLNMLHLNKFIWKDPKIYDPERFSPENAKTIMPYSYIPFSAGPRNCIGQHFAMNEMKIVAATIIRNFNLSLDEAIPVKRQNQLVLRAEEGIHLFVTPRRV